MIHRQLCVSSERVIFLDTIGSTVLHRLVNSITVRNTMSYKNETKKPLKHIKGKNQRFYRSILKRAEHYVHFDLS